MRPFRPWLAVLVAFGVSAKLHAQDSTRSFLQRTAGCYALTLGGWSALPLRRNGYPESTTPPARFRLDTLVFPSAWGPQLAVEPAHLVPRNIEASRPGNVKASWAVLSQDSIGIIWSDGFVGVRLRLAARGDSMVGLATTFHDAHIIGEPPDPSAPAVAVRAPCPPK